MSDNQTKIQNSITIALEVADLVTKLSTGVIDNTDSRLSTENVFGRKNYTLRNVSHLKRLMSQSWFTQSLDIDQFTTINDAIVAGEAYLG
jgi:hypothetical protein